MITFNELVVNKDTVLLFILKDGVVVGSVTYNQENNELYNLLIDIKHRGEGNAEALLKEAMFRYRPKTITASSCYGSDPVRLIKLYAKVGFKVDNVTMICSL